MWFAELSRDFADFKNSLLVDTRNLANLVTRIAAEVTGQERLLAGDEDSLLAQECPLEETTLLAFQRSTAVYLDPIDDEEEVARFAEWTRRSAYSTASLRAEGDEEDKRNRLNPQNRQDDDNDKKEEEEAEEAEEAEKEEETERAELQEKEQPISLAMYRQRLLDENPILAAQHAAFVITAKPNDRDDTTTLAQLDADGFEQTAHSPTRSLPNDQRISEDAFFDRYFFRLAQLRRRVGAEPHTAETAVEEETNPNRVEKRPPAPKEKKSLAERFMEAADELVGWDDKDHSHSKDDDHSSTSVSAGAPNTRALEEKVSALEEVVQLLQRELRVERHRLAAVLCAARQLGLTPAQWQRIEAAQRESPETTPEKERTSPKVEKDTAGNAESTNKEEMLVGEMSKPLQTMGGQKETKTPETDSSAGVDTDSWTAV